MNQYILNKDEIRLKKELEEKGYEFIDDGINKPIIKIENPPIPKGYNFSEEFFKRPEENARKIEAYLDLCNNPYFRDTNNYVHWSPGLCFDITAVH